MNQQPDKLFRDKLEGYQSPAPVSAWDKIETNLDKKSGKGLWLKIAASLLVLAAASYWLWPVGNTIDNAPSIAVHQPKTTENKGSLSDTVTNIAATPATPDHTSSQHSDTRSTRVPAKKNSIDNSVKNQNAIQQELSSQPAIAVIETSTTTLPAYDSATKMQPVEATAVTALTSVKEDQQKGSTITLVYTAEEVNEKYLTKNIIMDATPKTRNHLRLRSCLAELTI